MTKSAISNLETMKHTSYSSGNLTMIIVLMLIQTTLFFCEDMSTTFESSISTDTKLKKTIFHKTSILNKTFSPFSVIEKIRFISPETIIAIFGTIIILNSFIILLYFRTSFVEKLLLKFNSEEGDIEIKNFFLKILSFLVNYSEVIFMVVNILSISSVFCRTIQVPITSLDSTGVQGSSIKADYLELNTSGMQELTKPKRVNFLSDDVECNNNQGYSLVIGILGVLLILSNFGIKLIFEKIFCFSPSIGISRAKFGKTDWLIDLGVILGIIIRTVTPAYYSHDYEKVKIFMTVYFFILVIISIIHWNVSPYYSQRFLVLKNMQIIYLTTITGLYVMTSYKLVGAFFFDRQLNSMIVFIMITTFVLRFAANSKSYSNPNFIICQIKTGKMKKKLKSEELLGIYFSITRYIACVVEAKRKNLTLGKEGMMICFMINSLYEWHKSQCTYINCLCQGKKFENMTENTPIHGALNHEVFNENNFALKGLMICEEMLKRFVKENKNSGLIVTYTYIEFLIDYMGKPVLALNLLEKLKKQICLKRDKTTLEIEILKEKLDELVALNLMNGTLGLSCYHRLVHSEIHGKNGSIEAQDPILFLNSMERLKNQIKFCAEVKLKFLNDLSENSSFKNIFQHVKKFTDSKRDIAALSEKLVRRSRGQYPPLLHIMWKFVRDICEDYLSSNGFLILYKKALESKYSNLNLIFLNEGSMKKIKFHEFSTVYVSGEEKNFHKVIYCTSNMFDLTGKISKFLKFFRMEK